MILYVPLPQHRSLIAIPGTFAGSIFKVKDFGREFEFHLPVCIRGGSCRLFECWHIWICYKNPNPEKQLSFYNPTILN
jgi:hypothetical protein